MRSGPAVRQIEDHHAGADTAWAYLPDGMTYDIPYRTLVPQVKRGLLVAGRCFSATHRRARLVPVDGTDDDHGTGGGNGGGAGGSERLAAA